ncbi:adhesion G protein-coupled receptor B2 [Trichonephila clavipes]|nr:adhesion G protein-coupled receptor B2 [Trichonephila clavipes]
MGKYELPCSISRKTRRIREDFKRTLKQKSSSPFVKKQEFRFTKKNRSTNLLKDIKTQRAERVLQQKLRETLKSQCFQAYAQTNYSKSQKFKEPPKETCTLIVKEGLRTKEIFFGKVKITALIDSGSTDFWHMTATAGSDVVQSGRPIFDDFFQHLWPYISNNTANVVFQMVKRLWLIRIDQ